MSSGASKGAPKGGPKPKSCKSDSKPDKADLNPKIQASAEQMQIARIIDSHRSEDPELQKKIKQVMEITRATEDEASMALHSREYDIEQAITLLTEGGSQSLESEWAQAGKKRKPKAPVPKADLVPREKDRGVGRDGDRANRSEKRERADKPERGERQDVELGDQPFGSDQKRGDRGNSRGGARRGGRGGGRGGRVDNNKENDGVGRISNGPSRGRVIQGRGRGRTFASRGRREGDGYNTIDVWENSQADGASEATPLKVDNWDEFPSAEDWDNEEYTGSLADTKVFTPSQNAAAPPLSDATNGVGAPTNHVSTVATETSGDVKISKQESGGAVQNVSLAAVVSGIAAASGASTVVPGQIDLATLLSGQPAPNSAGSNAGANILASLQSSFANANQVANQLPPRHKVQRPRGPPSKIPASAVEMPDNSVSTLDVQFGGLDFGPNTAMTFNSVMHPGGKAPGDMLYGGPSKLDSFPAAGDKDTVQNKAVPPPSQSPFQSPRGAQGPIVEQSKGPNVLQNMDNLSMQIQKTVSQPYVANPGSAFVSYGGSPKVAPGFPAPGFPPVTNPNHAYMQNMPASNAYMTHGNLANQQQQTYQNMMNMAYNQPPVAPQVTMPGVVPVSQNVSSYGVASGPHQGTYHNTVAGGYGNSVTGSNHYGYPPKVQSMASGMGGKEGVNDVSTPMSPATTSSAQLGNIGTSGPGITASPSTSTTKMSTSNSGTPGSKMAGGIPPGMTMVPPYMLQQGAALPAAFYSVPQQFYQIDDSSVQLYSRLPPQLAGYYDASNAGFGSMPPNAGVSGRNDGPQISAFSAAGDSRFPRSDSSNSPVPSNIAGASQQQPMLNTGFPGYYLVGNNMVQGPHFAPAGYPPHLYQTAQLPPPNNTPGAQHGASSNHQYHNKGYNATYAYEGAQGPANDFGKNSYPGGAGVVPNSNSNKGASGSSGGNSQQTDMNSSMYGGGKGHNMNKMNQSYEKQGYGNSPGGGYNSMGAGANSMTTPMNNASMGYGVYIAPPVQIPPPMHQDGSTSTRQGSGQNKGKSQYGPYWQN